MVFVWAALMVIGAIIALVNPAMLVGKGEQIDGAARIYAGYLASRNLAIAAMLLGTLIASIRSAGSTGGLRIMMLLTAAVQMLDAGMDCIEGRWVVAPGVAIVGFVFLFGARRVSRTARRLTPAAALR
jgi:hypothetical protein